MRIDSHQHFWSYDPTQYPWITDKLAVLKRSFLPDDLTPVRKANGIEGSIAVQARQSESETEWLLELAGRHSSIVGVVGWVDLQSERLGESLDKFSLDPKFLGVRHVVQDEPDDRFMLRPEFLRGIGLLQPYNLTYDFLVYPNQLASAIEVARRFPEQTFILDHLAKPYVRRRELEPWKSQIMELASCRNVACKISGLITEADWNAWTPEDLRPYLDTVAQAFGVDRLLFGSDWPVCLLAGSYAQVCDLAATCFQSAGPAASRKIFGENAARLYRFEL